MREKSDFMTEKPKILILATTASMIEQFNMHNIKILQSLGAEVHVGTNFAKPGTIPSSISKQLISKLNYLGVRWHQIDFRRGVGTPKANKRALKQVCEIIKENRITGIHAHSPLGGIIGRRAAHRMHVKIIYTAHGLQFFKGGPLKDWLLFFPVEWFYAHWTNALVTINKDDYKVSSALPVKHRYYIPGVGIDLKRVKHIPDQIKKKERAKIRQKLGLNDQDFLIISVGELSKRKNHSTVIKALHKIKDNHIKYAIAGIGDEKKRLQKLIKEYHLEDRVLLLGYVNNLDGLYYAADLNIFRSKREGLGLGGLDGIAHGLYIIGNKRTGMKDYINVPQNGLLVDSPMNLKEIIAAIEKVRKNKLRVVSNSDISKFDHSHVDKLMRQIYLKEFFSE